MKTLESIQNELRELVPQGNDLVLAALKKTIRPGTDKYNDYLALEGRYQDVSRQLLQGVVSNEDATLEFNKIRQVIIEFIDCLETTDIPELASEENSNRGVADVYNGEVLYRIPKKMQLGIEEECVVRLAFDRTRLIQDFHVEVGDVMRDLRIADVMGVELLDPNSDKAFTITTVHDTVQFVEKDLVTEWIFCVTPLKEGQFPLVLKISIIEIFNGIERKRNEVLKEQVEIVTHKPVEGEMNFISAGYTWQVTGASEQRAMPGAINKGVETIEMPAQPAPAPRPAPAPIPQAPSPARSGGGFKKMGVLLGALAALIVAVIAMRGFIGYNADNKGEEAFVAIDDPEWEGVRKRRQRQELEDFSNKYPGTPEATVALNILDTIETEAWQNAVAINDFASMETYLNAYPNGKYADSAAYRMDDMNRAALVKVDSVIVIDELAPPNSSQTGSGQNQVAKPKSNNQVGPRHQQPAQKKPSTRPSSSGTTRPKPNISTPSSKPLPATKPAEPAADTKAKPDPNRAVLLVTSARKPVFKNCGNKDRKKEEKCTAERIHSYLSSRIKYPDEAVRNSIQGTVVVGFVIEKDGSITDVKTLNHVGGGCDEEAVRLIKNLPKFTPGKNGKGEPLRVQYTQPVTFRIEK